MFLAGPALPLHHRAPDPGRWRTGRGVSAMKRARKAEARLVPEDTRALIAVDLGAESCRVSLLRWVNGEPVIRLVHRFANAPRQTDLGLCWTLDDRNRSRPRGTRVRPRSQPRASAPLQWTAGRWTTCASIPKASLWPNPFCYRDERTLKAERALHRKCGPDRLRELTGIQILRINTLYQLYADKQQKLPRAASGRTCPSTSSRAGGGARVAEHTNATHTQMSCSTIPSGAVKSFPLFN